MKESKSKAKKWTKDKDNDSKQINDVWTKESDE